MSTQEMTCKDASGAVVSNRGRWRLALLLAVAALASGVLLTGASVWFLGAVAIAGAGPMAFTFNFHIPAALVRLFALSRTATKYGERVVGHRAALVDQVCRRSRLFAAMAAAPQVRRAGWQLARQDRLSDYIDDVEDVDYARLRVGLPLTGLAIGLGSLAALTLVCAPLALCPIAAFAAVSAAVYFSMMPQLHDDRRSVRRLERAGALRLGSVLAALVPLRAERAWQEALHDGFSHFDAAEAGEFRFRKRLVLLDALLRAAGPLAALSILSAAWFAGLRGNALLPEAFIAFGWLALGEGATGVSRIVSGHIRLKAAEENLWTWADGVASVASHRTALAEAGAVLTVCNLRRTTPDGRLLDGTIGFECRRGQVAALVGPSGCGKTTLLKQIAGWLPIDDDGSVLVDGAVASYRAEISYLGLHDAAILDDTVRENLFAKHASDAACWQALAAVELDDRVRTAGGLDAWITQDHLSLGEAQRLNLARAWLADMPLILLDEPTEHLDDAQGERILKRLALRFRDRIFLLATHRAARLADAGDVMLVEFGRQSGKAALRPEAS